MTAKKPSKVSAGKKSKAAGHTTHTTRKSSQAPRSAAVRKESEQRRFAQKIKLDQIASSVTGGTTGLLMLLDVMLNDVKEENTNSFYFHADSYIQRMGRLEKLLNSYRQLGVENREVQQYQGLLEIGRDLQTLPAPEKITKERLEHWRVRLETWANLYNEQEG